MVRACCRSACGLLRGPRPHSVYSCDASSFSKCATCQAPFVSHEQSQGTCCSRNDLRRP